MSLPFSNNINSLNTAINVLNNCTIADDRSQILTWLSPLEPRLRHQDIRDCRAQDVGEWLLQTEEFENWYAGNGGSESDNGVLFCYGDPGVGKTYICSLVIDRLCDQAEGQDVAVGCFYFDFADQKEQSSPSMLGALLKQVVGGLGEIPGEITNAYENQKKVIGGRGPQLSDIVKMLQTTSSERRTFICIDALDECAPGYRVKLLDSLHQILQKSPGTRIFVTGRPHIQDEIRRRLSGRVTTIRITPKRADIIRYLRTRLSEDTTPDAMDSSLEADILKRIPDDISEIFLLVSLNIDAILREPTIHRRRQKLNAMTDGLGLGDAYGATLGRIKGQDGEKVRLAMAALMWISHAERPLKPDELCHALAVEIGSPNLNVDNAPSIGTLLACCQGLAVVDREASIVRLIHFTLQEYLRAHPELFNTAHSTIAETCLSYLNSQQVKALSTSPSPDLQSTPFLEYSSLYWGMHAKKDLSDRVKQLALELFDDHNNQMPIETLLQAHGWYFSSVAFNKSSPFSGLHHASFFGIDEIVADLVEVEGCDINQKDCVGNTPLLWAARNGHEGVVEILLRRGGIDPDKPDREGLTPLCCAALNGCEAVAKILLGRGDVNPDGLNVYHRTPLWCAALHGHEGVVKILLGRDDVDPNKPDKNGFTPLFGAAFSGQEGVVKILLGRKDVNPNKPDNESKTPLWCAAVFGRQGVVKILLARDGINPDIPDKNGQTPLWCAASCEREEILQMLLRRDDVDPEKLNQDGRTPLSWASWNGRERLVKILLGRDDINPNKRDGNSLTPLHCAVLNGHEGVVKTLLAREDLDPDRPDNRGQTPLWWAALAGHEEMVKMLLGRSDVNPDRPDNHGQTPLFWTAICGHEGVMKMLLGRGVNPDKKDRLGLTPLSYATSCRHQGVIALLQPLAPSVAKKPFGNRTRGVRRRGR